MARPPRIDFADAVYHVTSRGNGRAKIFWSDADRLRFLARLADNLHAKQLAAAWRRYRAYTHVGVMIGVRPTLVISDRGRTDVSH